MKDNFSTQSQDYARYRPTYPPALFAYIATICKNFKMAWDCGTGNGQVASELAEIFEEVYATDISQAQLDHAIRKKNIHYSLQPAEQTNFSENLFDLVIVAQAVHWFEFDQFYAEVKRTAKKEGIIAIVGYGRLHCGPEIDQWVDELYGNIVGSYWDSERKYIDENYQTIPFPFKEIRAPAFTNSYEWTFDQLLGYIETWSAVQHYKRQHGESPVGLIHKKLEECWGRQVKRTISFPLLLRLGKAHG